jgi:hypothetical protein
MVPPGGGLDNVPTHFDASGTSAGEVYTADIVFTSDPDVGTITIPCTMTILTWEWTGEAFQYFVVKRDGMVIGSTTNMYFTDFVPDYGEYCYTVQAYYDEGMTAPAGPE